MWKNTMTKMDYFRAVANAVLSLESADEDVLALMLVLHTHCLHFPASVKLTDAGQGSVLAALTRHSSAEAVASAFPVGDKRNNNWHWFWTLNERAAYSGTFEMPDEWKQRVLAMISLLKRTGLVSEVTEEE
jgi:hypothetical protein